MSPKPEKAVISALIVDYQKKIVMIVVCEMVHTDTRHIKGQMAMKKDSYVLLFVGNNSS
jgi:hypothetical protein